MIWDYICGSTMHEILVMTVVNLIINVITLTLVLTKSPVKVIEDKRLSGLRLKQILEYLALIAENELLRIENEKITCRVHGVSSVLRK